jgi:hypothetical protein
MDGGLVAGHRDQPDALASLQSLSAGLKSLRPAPIMRYQSECAPHLQIRS